MEVTCLPSEFSDMHPYSDYRKKFVDLQYDFCFKMGYFPYVTPLLPGGQQK
jgi:hypothetical protein